MSRKLQASIVAAAFGTLIVSLLVVGFLFRQRTVNYPELGLTTYKWRWGRAAVLENDTNRDGLVDFRAEFSRWSTEFSIHDTYHEAWESSRCDGYLDRHLVADSNGQVITLEIDRDRDGSYEVAFDGEEARAYLAEHPRALECRW